MQAEQLWTANELNGQQMDNKQLGSAMSSHISHLNPLVMLLKGAQASV